MIQLGMFRRLERAVSAGQAGTDLCRPKSLGLRQRKGVRRPAKRSVRLPQTEASSPSDLTHSSAHFLETMRRSVDKVLGKEIP